MNNGTQANQKHGKVADQQEVGNTPNATVTNDREGSRSVDRIKIGVLCTPSRDGEGTQNRGKIGKVQMWRINEVLTSREGDRGEIVSLVSAADFHGDRGDYKE